MGQHWTDPQIAMLEELWGHGASASQVATKINTVFGTHYTRSAIIGRIHRMGLQRGEERRNFVRTHPGGPLIRRVQRARKTAKRKKDGASAQAVRAANMQRSQDAGIPQMFKRGRRPKPPRPAGKYELPETEHTGTVKAVLEIRDGQCRWPIGSPVDPDFRFCGAKTGGRVYCAHHHYTAHHGGLHDEKANEQRCH